MYFIVLLLLYNFVNLGPSGSNFIIINDCLMKEWLFVYNLYYFSCDVQGYNTLEYYSLFKVCYYCVIITDDLLIFLFLFLIFNLKILKLLCVIITDALLIFLFFLFLIYKLKILKLSCVISNRVIDCYVFKGSIWGFWDVTKSAKYFISNLVSNFPNFTYCIQTFFSFLIICMTGSFDPMSVT